MGWISARHMKQGGSLGPYAAGEFDRIAELARWRASRGGRTE